MNFQLWLLLNEKSMKLWSDRRKNVITLNYPSTYWETIGYIGYSPKSLAFRFIFFEIPSFKCWTEPLKFMEFSLNFSDWPGSMRVKKFKLIVTIVESTNRNWHLSRSSRRFFFVSSEVVIGNGAPNCEFLHFHRWKHYFKHKWVEAVLFLNATNN